MDSSNNGQFFDPGVLINGDDWIKFFHGDGEKFEIFRLLLFLVLTLIQN